MKTALHICRKLVIITACFLVVATVSFAVYLWNRFLYRYPYSPETRYECLDSGPRAYLPSMETNLRFADVVIRGKIVSDGEAVNKITDPNGVVQRSDGIHYKVKVNEVILGNLDKDKITVRFWGTEETGCAKPHRNDELVLFLYLQEFSGQYMPADSEYSMFAVMPDDTLYSFSGRFSEMDGQSVNNLYDGVEKAVQAIRSNPEEYYTTSSSGAVLDEILAGTDFESE